MAGILSPASASPDNTVILDYSCKKKSTKSDYDHNIVALISDNCDSDKSARVIPPNAYSSHRLEGGQGLPFRPFPCHNGRGGANSAFRTYDPRFGLNAALSLNQCDTLMSSTATDLSSLSSRSRGGKYKCTISSSISDLDNRTSTSSCIISTLAIAAEVPEEKEERHINTLYPEILTHIFSYLALPDKGRASQVCKYWQQVSYEKVIWRGTEAKIHLKSKGNSVLYSSLTKRGIHQVQILSLKKSLRELFMGLPGLTRLNLSGCYNVTDWTLFSSSSSSNHGTTKSDGNHFHYSSSSRNSSRTYPTAAASISSLSSSASSSIQLQHLTTLDLSLCKQISDISLPRVAHRAQNLQTLELGGCCQITDRGLLIIAWGFKKLTRLNLRSCHLVTDVGIGFLSGIVTREHLSEPKTHEFLTKFGLIAIAPETQQQQRRLLSNDANASSGSDKEQSSLSPSSLMKDIGLTKKTTTANKSVQSGLLPLPLEYEPTKVKRSRTTKFVCGSDSNQQQQQQQHCSLCHQLLPLQQQQPENSNRKRKWSHYNALAPTSQQQQQLSQQPPTPPEKINPNTTIFGTLRLQALVLQDCQKLTDTCLTYIAPSSEKDTTHPDSPPSHVGLPNLQHLNLSFCIHITDTGLKQLGKLNHISELNLRSCDSITDYGLANLKEVGSRLHTLDISFCDKINNIGLGYLSQWVNNLKSLSMSSCNVSDSGVAKIAMGLRQLEILHLGQCSKVTDEAVKIIAEKCTRIKYIDLYGCNRVSKEGLEVLKGLPQVVQLNLGL